MTSPADRPALSSSTRWIALAVALAVAAALGWWGYGAYQKREVRRALLAYLDDTGARARDAVTIHANAAQSAGADTLSRLNEHFAVAGRHYQAFRDMREDRIRDIAEAADDYLLSSRELLRRVAEAARLRIQLGASLQSLRDHMRADNRSGAWVNTALRLKGEVDRDYRAYKAATDALAQQLASYPASQAKIAPYLGPKFPTDPASIEAARTRTLEEARRTAIDHAQTVDLEAYR